MENTEKKQPLVQVKNLCKYFEISRKETLKAVDDLTFDIYKGETVSLVGESGCGKSTTGRTMIKLYNPTSGNVYYDGKDIFKYNHAEQKEFCKKVQMIFQNPYSRKFLCGKQRTYLLVFVQDNLLILFFL